MRRDITIDIDRCTLDTMAEGETALLCHIEKGHPLCERLLDLGWTENTPVRCVRVSPLGDPVAYSVRGSVIALRRSDGRGIFVRCGQGL